MSMCVKEKYSARELARQIDSGYYERILDLREGNEESSEETTGCKAGVYEEFDDCTRAEKLVKHVFLMYHIIGCRIV